MKYKLRNFLKNFTEFQELQPKWYLAMDPLILQQNIK